MITVTDILDWCAEHGEEFFDYHNPISINYFLGYLASVDPELFEFTLAKQLESFDRYGYGIEIQEIWSNDFDTNERWMQVTKHLVDLVNKHQYTIDKVNECLSNTCGHWSDGFDNHLN